MPPTKPKRVTLNLRIPKNEHLLLTKSARAQGRTKTDLIRAFIRSLNARPD